MKIVVLLLIIVLLGCVRPYYGDHRFHKFRPVDTTLMKDGSYMLEYDCIKPNCDSRDTFLLKGNERFI